MGRVKSSIGRYTRKTIRRRDTQNKDVTVHPTCNFKRKFTTTPLKSPYKSPLYKTFSPVKKKLKSARSLFGSRGKQNEEKAIPVAIIHPRTGSSEEDESGDLLVEIDDIERALSVKQDETGDQSEQIDCTEGALTVNRDEICGQTEQIKRTEGAVTVNQDKIGGQTEQTNCTEGALTVNRDQLGGQTEQIKCTEGALTVNRDEIGGQTEQIKCTEGALTVNRDDIGGQTEQIDRTEGALTVNRYGVRGQTLQLDDIEEMLSVNRDEKGGKTVQIDDKEGAVSVNRDDILVELDDMERVLSVHRYKIGSQTEQTDRTEGAPTVNRDDILVELDNIERALSVNRNEITGQIVQIDCREGTVSRDETRVQKVQTYGIGGALSLGQRSEETNLAVENTVNSRFEKSENEDLRNNTAKMLRLVPVVMKHLSEKDGLDVVMTNFFEMVADGTFPLDNIAFLLWSEVVKWYTNHNTTQMRYSSQTKLFWKLGWRLFGKRFINYMGGFKSHGEIVLNLTEKGKYKPATSEINFAVPGTNILRQFEPYGNRGERKPGIFEDTLCMLSDSLHNRSACITFDGKKIKQGLTPESGDVDLLGREKGLSLTQRKDALESDISEVLRVEQTLLTALKDVRKIGTNDQKELIDVLMNCLTKMSEKINGLLILRERKEYCKQKLIERSGDSDWKKGRFAFAISSVIAFIYEIDEFVKHANSVTESICRHIAFLNNANYVDGVKINITSNERFVPIEIQQRIEDVTHTRHIKQRSKEWFKIREKATVTGSTIYKAVGCEGLGKQKDYFEKIMCGVAEKEPSESARLAMKHGTENEENAVGTLIGKVLPVITPDLIFCEEGCCAVHDEKGNIFMVVSPDGSLRKDSTLESSVAAVEIKCPMKKAHTEFPDRYLLQCLAEIYVLDVQYLIYASWTNDVTTVFKVIRNDSVLLKAAKICMELYCTDKTKKPTKLTEATKQLKKEIANESRKVKFIGRFKSCTLTDDPTKYSNGDVTPESIIVLLTEICRSYRDCYELQRERATEAVVFLVADLDRSWKKDTIRCSPIGWFPKGYSLDCDTMREIAEEVHNACTNKGIHAPCESFDGQWHPLVVRDSNGDPLTLYQLQREIWKRVERKTKKEILDYFKNLNKEARWEKVTDMNSINITYPRIIVTNGGLCLPKYRRVERKIKKVVLSVEDNDFQATTLIDTVPDLVRETADVGKDVMASTSITDVLEMEAFAINADDEDWSRELQCHENDSTLVEKDNAERQEQDTDVELEEVNSGLDEKDMECILSMWKTTKDCNKKMKWNNITSTELLEYFSSYRNLSKLLDVEIRAIVRYLKKTKGMSGVKESCTKQTKLDGIAKFLAIELPDSPTVKKVYKRPHVRSVCSLRDICVKVVSKYSKQDLNVALAEYMFPNEYQSWKKSVEGITVDGERQDWFYKPEYSNSRKQVEVKCIDSTHLLTRTRRKTCAGGIEGMTNEAWTKVAKQKSTLLTPIMVEEITDPMSMAMAKTHFSEGVEAEMRKNGDVKAADLVRDIRDWWESEDTPGIPACNRIEKRKALRRRLTSKWNFARFPPPTQYVCGWPVQLWEALIASIDAKSYLYALVHGGTYNVRAFSSLIGETFFSELTLNDKRGQGTVSALEFGQFIGNATEQLQARLDQERKFAFCTSKTKVYDTVDESCESEAEHKTGACRICNGQKGIIPRSICTRNHPFDKEERKRIQGRQNRGHVSLERGALLKGSLGVRWEKARCNMAKMLPTKRMGICD